jgi:hypothetical protein
VDITGSADCGLRGQWHYRQMGSTRVRSSRPDLFATPSAQELSSQTSPAPAVPISRHVLPKDLPNAIKQLEDHELDLLLSAVLDEKKRRGNEHSDPKISRHKQSIEVVSVPLTQGRLNAIRAAFKAGVTPSRIARQFGISQSDVRKALASGTAPR